MLTIIAEIRTQSGGQHRQDVLDAFQKIIPTVLAEEGCHGYEPLIDHKSNASFQTQEEPDTIVMLEKWESVAHLEAHLATPHMQAHHKAVKDDVVDVKIRILESGA
ncbi:putative quinol monooxygenase [Acinetobacter nosocomialis]|uniref:putative quinol monooxygenase n=1 Tax=Acinetobacter nosocomialis TaxID=106654 RepID=UPI00244B565E|nr:putative quinol monooxygenase [Acinetobacter nosocomialis]MDH2591875.1 putative quinol monooxygenase [Acinetobacter nosocomialis]